MSERPRVDINYISPTKGEMPLTRVMAEIAEFVAERPDIPYILAIGTDSQFHNDNGSSHVDFVTAIVIYGEGRGGRFFTRKIKEPGRMILQNRIWQEAMMSLEQAQNIVEGFSHMLGDLNLNFQIHVDVGPKGKTSSMIAEVTGAVRGNGFEPVIKPGSFASSSVADGFTH